MNQLKAVEQNSSSDDEVIELIVRHVLAAGNMHLDTESDRSSWIVDSSATCHICNDMCQFVYIEDLPKPMEVVLRDGHVLQASKAGTVD